MESYKCLLCGKEFFRWNIKNKSSIKFCSKKCYRESPREWIKPIIPSDEKKKERVKKSFENNVIKKDGCWDWKGSKTNFGYGKTTKYFKLWAAHRASWFLYYGPIPDGKCVLHKCDNPICSNPEHLFLGDKKSNNNDRHQKLRDARGSKDGNAKLDERKVREIKNMLKKGHSQDMIAKKFDMHQTQISRIKLGKTWKHVEV